MRTTQEQGSKMPRRQYPYGRESDPSQMTGDGPKRQADFHIAISRELGTVLDDTRHYFDAGRSGFHGEHLGPKGELTRVLKDIREGRIPPGSVLSVENLDRLDRRLARKALKLFLEIIDAGVWIATAEPKRLYRDEDLSEMDLLEFIFLASTNHRESASKSSKLLHVQQSIRQRAREGVKRGGKLPPWVRLINGEYKPIPERVAALHKVYSLIVKEGLGLGRTVAWLNEHIEQYPPWGHGTFRKEQRGPAWSKPSLQNLLSHRSVVGEYQPYSGRKEARKPTGEPIKGYYPVVFTEDEYATLQAALRSRSPRHGGRPGGRPGEREPNLFTDLVFLSGERCRLQMLGCTGRNGITYRYLSPGDCRLAGRSGLMFPYHQFEDGILRTVQSLLTVDVLPPTASALELEKRVAELGGRVGKVRSRLQEIQDAIADPNNGQSVVALVKAQATLTEEEQALTLEWQRARLDSKTSQGEALEDTKNILQELERVKGTEEEAPIRRRLKTSLRDWIDEIWLVSESAGRVGRYVRLVLHVQLFLRGGKMIYRQLLPGALPTGFVPAHLGKEDFRTRNVCHSTK